MATRKDLLLEEYKILEKRYQNDTNRYWTQSQIFLASNAAIATVAIAVFSNSNNRGWFQNLGLIMTAMGFIGVAISLAWFFSLATERAYLKFSKGKLIEIEDELDLPVKVFKAAKATTEKFEWWEKIGGREALLTLAFVLASVWIFVLAIGLLRLWLYCLMFYGA